MPSANDLPNRSNRNDVASGYPSIISEDEGIIEELTSLFDNKDDHEQLGFPNYPHRPVLREQPESYTRRTAYESRYEEQNSYDETYNEQAAVEQVTASNSVAQQMQEVDSQAVLTPSAQSKSRTVDENMAYASPSASHEQERVEYLKSLFPQNAEEIEQQRRARMHVHAQQQTPFYAQSWFCGLMIVIFWPVAIILVLKYKHYEKPWFAVFSSIFLWPLGIVLLLKYKHFSKGVRYALIIMAALLTISFITGKMQGTI